VEQGVTGTGQGRRSGERPVDEERQHGRAGDQVRRDAAHEAAGDPAAHRGAVADRGIDDRKDRVGVPVDVGEVIPAAP